jgi:hypothetical protein
VTTRHAFPIAGVLPCCARRVDLLSWADDAITPVPAMVSCGKDVPLNLIMRVYERVRPIDWHVAVWDDAQCPRNGTLDVADQRRLIETVLRAAEEVGRG